MLIFILFILFIIFIMILEMINNYQEQKLLKQLATFDKNIKVSDYQYQQYSQLIECFIKLVLKDKNISYQQYKLSKGCIAFLGVNDMNITINKFPTVPLINGVSVVFCYIKQKLVNITLFLL